MWPPLRQSCARAKARLALVLPATVCTGPSWEQTRALIQQNFVLDMVITSHDPSRWNFSDSTDPLLGFREIRPPSATGSTMHRPPNYAEKGHERRTRCEPARMADED